VAGTDLYSAVDIDALVEKLRRRGESATQWDPARSARLLHTLGDIGPRHTATVGGPAVMCDQTTFSW